MGRNFQTRSYTSIIKQNLIVVFTYWIFRSLDNWKFLYLVTGPELSFYNLQSFLLFRSSQWFRVSGTTGKVPCTADKVRTQDSSDSHLYLLDLSSSVSFSLYLFVMVHTNNFGPTYTSTVEGHEVWVLPEDRTNNGRCRLKNLRLQCPSVYLDLVLFYTEYRGPLLPH